MAFSRIDVEIVPGNVSLAVKKRIPKGYKYTFVPLLLTGKHGFYKPIMQAAEFSHVYPKSIYHYQTPQRLDTVIPTLSLCNLKLALTLCTHSACS